MVTCERCACTFEDMLPACPHCGAPQPGTIRSAAARVSRGLRCPACGQMDKVRKVSALYEAAQAPGTLALADRPEIISHFAPPAEPPAPWLGPSGGRPLLISSLIGLLAGGLLAFLVTVMGINTANHGLLAFAICATGAVAAFLGCSAIFETRTRRSVRVKLESYNAAYRDYLGVYDRWQSLYYCGRDRIVYLPDTDQCAPAANMLDLCYGRSGVTEPSS